MLKILQVIGRMNRGGAESLIMNLYRAIDRSKVQFDFVEHYAEKAEYDDEILKFGGRIYRCPQYNGKNHFQYTKWWNTFFSEHENEYSVIHGHIGSTAAIYLSIAKKFGSYTIAHSHSTKMSFRYALFSFPTRYIADYFFGCSELAGIYRYGNRICSSARFTVLNNSIDIEKFTYSEDIRRAKRAEFGFSDETLVLGTVANLSSVKNPMGLMDIFTAVHRQRPDSKLLWVGEGGCRKQIEERAASEGLTDSVILTGSRSDVPQLLQAMDAFLLPSFSEGLPVSAIEAQASGTHCFLSEAVSKEVDVTGNCTFLPLGDAQLWAKTIFSSDLNKKDTRQQIIDAGYDIDTTAKFLQDFYLNCADR